MALREDALKEVRRLVSLLSERYKFESIYIYGSILSDRFVRHSDIDMVIKGLKVSDFFKAHAYLIKESKDFLVFLNREKVSSPIRHPHLKVPG